MRCVGGWPPPPERYTPYFLPWAYHQGGMPVHQGEAPPERYTPYKLPWAYHQGGPQDCQYI